MSGDVDQVSAVASNDAASRILQRDGFSEAEAKTGRFPYE